MTGLDLPLAADEISSELRRSLHDGIARDDLSRLIVLNARTLIEQDADFTRFAARIMLSYVYEEVLDWRIDRDGVGALRVAHVAAFRSLLERGVACGRIDEQLLGYDLDRLAAAIDPSADLELDFLGVQTLYDRYLIVDKTGVAPREARDAAVLLDARRDGPVPRREERPRELRALDLYGLYRVAASARPRRRSSTPARSHSQLSSCYLYNVDDSLESIMQRGIAENALLSKWAGGLGGSWTAVRGTGAHIGGTNGEIARASSRSSSSTTTSSSPSTRAASARAPAAPTSRPGTTTSSSSSSCAATPATTAVARTT